MPSFGLIALNEIVLEVFFHYKKGSLHAIAEHMHSKIAVGDLKIIHLWNVDCEPKDLERFLDSVLDLVDPA